MEPAKQMSIGVKERGILFKAEMVRSILEGRKWQTRRVVKPQPGNVGGCYTRPDGLFIWTHLEVGKGVGVGLPVSCHYGNPGDRLWVKETFCCKMDNGTFVYRPDGHHDRHYAADGYEVIKDDGDGGVEERADGTQASPWKPSIFMPRWASRITLDIVSVKVERVQQITEEDAIAEGIQKGPANYFGCGVLGSNDYPTCLMHNTAALAYAHLWDSINAKTHPWSSNPWVFVIEFKKL